MINLSNTQKSIAVAIAILSLLMAINEYGDYKHQKGYDAAIVDINSQASVELVKENQKAIDDIAEDNADAVERVRVEYITQEKIKEVVKYVDREIQVPAECNDTVRGIVRMRAEATSIINSAAKGQDAERPADAVPSSG